MIISPHFSDKLCKLNESFEPRFFKEFRTKFTSHLNSYFRFGGPVLNTPLRNRKISLSSPILSVDINDIADQ